MKLVSLILAFGIVLTSCATTQPVNTDIEPTQMSQTPQNLQLFWENNKKVAEITPEGKIALEEGGDYEQVAKILLAQLGRVNVYHEQFKRDIISTCGDVAKGLPKKTEPKVASKKK